MRLGLIVNPIAGIGGRVGLKGSDGSAVQHKALEMGAVPNSELRTRQALELLAPLTGTFELFTAPGEMGENIARESGFLPYVLGGNLHAPTSAGDTIQAARDMLDLQVDLLIFAGGDGTARDIFNAVGTAIPVLGIPTGVKIYSSCFSIHPDAAGEIVAGHLRGDQFRLLDAEVIDLDEDAYRSGEVTTRLYGYLKVPYRKGLVQNKKAPTPASEAVRAEAIAAEIIDSMLPGWHYIIGPGSTTRAIAQRLGFPKTLVGVDVYTRDSLVALDANEKILLDLLESRPAKVIVTPIGGQGFIFGRGNQQFSPAVIRKVGRENIIVVSLAEKIHGLKGQPFLVDTGDASVDALLAGYIPVITGYHEKVIYRVAS